MLRKPASSITHRSKQSSGRSRRKIESGRRTREELAPSDLLARGCLRRLRRSPDRDEANLDPLIQRHRDSPQHRQRVAVIVDVLDTADRRRGRARMISTASAVVPDSSPGSPAGSRGVRRFQSRNRSAAARRSSCPSCAAFPPAGGTSPSPLPEFIEPLKELA